jgi:hypothetical protein
VPQEQTPAFYREAEYNPDLPTLKSALGYEYGERISRPTEIERYARLLAEATTRARLVEYGRSVEGRPLIYLTISAPENLEREAEIRQNLRRLADPRACDRQEAAALIERTPPVSWVAANVHGGEHSTAEAALLLAYHLAAGEDERSRRIRERSVVVIDPLQNPDGRERSVTYYYSAFGRTVNADANAAEHHSPWPGPRGNHYLFDLNRDWMLLSQAETPPKVRAFLDWRPQVYADLHEMGHNSTFFFFPPAVPVNANYPEVTLRWWEIYGRAIAAWFDEYGFDYYARERFDAFYPGYGESWPSFHGASGMTFEQASVRGIAIRRDDGVDLTLREALHHHFIAALATCDLTASRPEERLWDFYAFHEDGVFHGRHSPVKEYLIPPQPGARRLAENLSQQGLEVLVAAASFSAQQAVDAVSGECCEIELPAGTFIYRLDQPYSRYLQAVMEPRTELPGVFVEEEIANEAARLPDRFYDITAWSRPLALGLRMFETRGFSVVASQGLGGEPGVAGGRRAKERRSVKVEAPRPPPPAAAFLLPGQSAAAAAAAAALLRGGFRVHCARKPFATGGRDYMAGAFVLRRAGNEGVADALHELQAQYPHELDVAGVPTLWTDAGIDLGSEDLIYLKNPRIAVLYDWPVSSLSFGWTACLLEQRYRIPFTAVRREQIGAADFREYDVLVLPNGDGYGRAFDGEQDQWLRAWVRAGGVLVGIGRAAAHLCRPEADLTAVRVVDDLRKAASGEAAEPLPSEAPAAPGQSTPPAIASSPAPAPAPPVPPPHRPVRVPGAFLQVDLDPHHPLTFGYQSPTHVFYDGSLLLARGPETHAAAAFAPADRLVVSGFVWEKMARALPGHLWAAEEACGRGHVVLFAFDPAYRTAWDHMHRFLLNALLLMPSVKRPA